MPRRLFSAWIPPLVWVALIFIGSTDVLSAEHTSRFLVPFLRWLNPAISGQTIETIHVCLRKLGHVSEYAVLAALCWRALRITLAHSRTARLALLTLVVSAGLAAFDEFHQSYVASRTASPLDVLVDCAGAAVAIAICWRLSRKRRRVG